MTEGNSSAFHGIIGFTGRLASMRREAAFALVRKQGGMPRRGVTKKTRVLIVGQLGWPLFSDGKPSGSLVSARALGIQVASERRFLEWAGLATPDEQLRSYDARQIASLSDLPVDVIELLTAFGLLDSREGRYGFRDVASARQLAGLIARGVKLSTITKTLHDLRDWMPDASLASVKLSPISSDKILIEHMRRKSEPSGQFVLSVDDTRDNEDFLFEQAQTAERAGDGALAARLYAKLLRLDPSDCTAAFNLGNLLRDQDRKIEAEAAYRAAVRADPAFAEAWYNLADLLDDAGHRRQAIECLMHAIAAEPDYPDALYNLGVLHQKENRPLEAISFLRRYLAIDPESSWAFKAKQALKLCEMQLAASR